MHSIKLCLLRPRIGTSTKLIPALVRFNSSAGLLKAIRNRDFDKLQNELKNVNLGNINEEDIQNLSALAVTLPQSSSLDELSLVLAGRQQPKALLKVFKRALTSGDSKKVIDMYTRLDKDSVDTLTLLCVVAAYSLIGNYRGAQTAVENANKPGYTFNPKNTALHTGLTNDKLALAQDYISKLRFYHDTKTKVDLISAIDNADLYAAVDIATLEDDEIYARFIQAFTSASKRGSPPLPAHVLDKPYSKLGPKSLNAALQGAFVRSTGTTNVNNILNAMNAKNVLPDEDIASALVSDLISKDRKDAGMALFDTIQEMYTNSGQGVPTKICNALLSGLTKVGMSDVALDVFKQIKEPSIVTYNILIRYSVLKNDHATTINLLRELRERGITPDAHTFSMLLVYLRKRGHGEAINVVMKTMTDCGVTPDLHIYSGMIDILAKEGQLKEAITLLDRIEDEGVKTTSVTYTSVISGYLLHSSDGLQEAQKLMARMKLRGLSPTPVLFNYIIEASLASQNAYAPWVFLEQMQYEPNVHITKGTLYILMKGFYESRRYDDCKRLLDFIDRHDLTSLGDDALNRIINKIKRKL
ncbi:hypothetical protein E3Q06_01586 [Wallemia mellicola]|nr:hypothetical protein E3Q21_01686 [Wallemia mellicola]TIB89426.1 hypothetical protein E3Q20_01676 [Wallemia mellicola]TIC11370.1 hypothetical protein E3Q15_02699 [Wallemia mellicola]TIC22310.1 hypothetical protein E3Q12_02789 [Wallemia mellicola]TIC35983.1 hypothetical protein E3Q09_01745 [Wallemia mellicola]